MSGQFTSTTTATWRRSLPVSHVFLLGLGLLVQTGCGVASNGLNAEGTRYFQQGNHAAAIRRFEEAIAINPQDSDSYYNLGATYHRLAKTGADTTYWNQAETHYNQCLDLHPNHTECYRGLAVMLSEQGRHDQARRLLEGWKQRAPFSPEPKVELARLEQELGNNTAAEENLLEAIAQDNTNIRARTALGKMREDAGDYPQALANYQVALSRNRMQPQVQSRVAALNATLNPTPVFPNAAGTRTVTNPVPFVRY